MATKKQKREAMAAKRAAFEAQVKADGLKALQRDREHQAAIESEIKTAAERINARHREILQPESTGELRLAQNFVRALYIGGQNH